MANVKYFLKYFIPGMAAGFVTLVVTGAIL